MEADVPGPSCTRRTLLAATALTLASCSAGSPGPAPAAQVDEPAFAALLAARSKAVLSRDPQAFLATIDPDEPGFRARQEELFKALVLLPLTAWQEKIAKVEDGLLTLHLSYRLKPYDQADVVRTIYLRAARRPTGWLIVDDGAPDHKDDPEIWTSPDFSVLEGEHSLVLGSGPLKSVSAQLDRSVPLVTAVVGRSWPRRAVALVPADAERARELADDQDLRDIVALATVTRNADKTQGQPRILISPETWPRLNPLGRQVVITHELTHIAMNSPGDTKTPMWLIEGFADYVGYRATTTSPTKAAQELAAEVRKGKVPKALPTRESFAASSSRLSQAYQEAWLACRMIAATYGEPRLLALYKAASRLPEPEALRQVLGTTGITEAWRAYLKRELA